MKAPRCTLPKSPYLRKVGPALMAVDQPQNAIISNPSITYSRDATLYLSERFKEPNRQAICAEKLEFDR